MSSVTTTYDTARPARVTYFYITRTYWLDRSTLVNYIYWTIKAPDCGHVNLTLNRCLQLPVGSWQRLFSNVQRGMLRFNVAIKTEGVEFCAVV